MARRSRRRRIRTTLRCNKCEHQFEGLARFVSIETADRGTMEWRPATDAAMGNECPQCGSEAIGRPRLTNRKGRDACAKPRNGSPRIVALGSS